MKREEKWDVGVIGGSAVFSLVIMLATPYPVGATTARDVFAAGVGLFFLTLLFTGLLGIAVYESTS